MLDASGLIHVDKNYFLVAEDEIDQLRIFEFSPETHSFSATDILLDFGAQESDFESIAYDPAAEKYYCIGSYSADYSRLLMSFQLQDLKVSNVEKIPFEPEILLQRPINIESLSVVQDGLFIGYRSPSFSEKAIATIYNPTSGAQLITLFDLENRVFRDMVRIDNNNYLILAGPEKGKHYNKYPSKVYWWNGELFSPRLETCLIDLVDFRAESICVRENESGCIDVLVGSDESKIKQAKQFRMLYFSVINLPQLFNEKQKGVELTVRL